MWRPVAKMSVSNQLGKDHLHALVLNLLLHFWLAHCVGNLLIQYHEKKMDCRSMEILCCCYHHNQHWCSNFRLARWQQSVFDATDVLCCLSLHSLAQAYCLLFWMKMSHFDLCCPSLSLFSMMFCAFFFSFHSLPHMRICSWFLHRLFWLDSLIDELIQPNLNTNLHLIGYSSKSIFCTPLELDTIIAQSTI